ncbi:hypothetical protein D9M71_234980 [compost metagenome]
MRQRRAVAVDRALGRVLGEGGGHRAVLGHAPGGDDLRVHHRSGPFHQRAGDRRAGGEEGAQRRQRVRMLRGDLDQVGEEGRRGHGEGRPFGGGDARGELRVPDVLQHGAALQVDGHHQAVEEAGLVCHRRGHEDHVVAAQMQALGIRAHVGEQGVGGVQHAFRLAGGAGGVEQLHHVVGMRAACGEQRRGVGFLFPGAAHQQLLEGVLAADHQYVAQVRQVAAQAVEHGAVVEAAVAVRDHHHPALGVGQHEAQLAFAEDRHQRVEHRADAHAGQVQRHHLPPVGQLARHHVARFHPQRGQAAGHPRDATVEFRVAQLDALVAAGAVGDQCRPVGAGSQGVIQIICNDPVIPCAGGKHGRTSLRLQVGADLHELTLRDLLFL